jgi:ADP-ribosylglycohydrolase
MDEVQNIMWVCLICGMLCDVISTQSYKISDHCELMIETLEALTNSDITKHQMHENLMAYNYIHWYNSRPHTSENVIFEIVGKYTYNGYYMMGKTMRQVAIYENTSNESNTAFLRCAPIACWAREQPVDIIMNFARENACLSHPNIICQDSNAAFCVALSHILLTADPIGAIDKVYKLRDNGYFCEKVTSWLYLSETIENIHQCENELKKINEVNGHVIYPFFLAFTLMKITSIKGHSFEQALCDLQKMSFFKESSCICGYVLGAIYGRLPHYSCLGEHEKEIIEYDTYNIVRLIKLI